MFSSSAVCGSLSRRPAVLAGVAVRSISVAATKAVCAVGFELFAVESAAARVCREAGSRVITNVKIQDMDVLRCWPMGGPCSTAPNCLWTPLWCLCWAAILSCCVDVDGVIFEEAKRRKEHQGALMKAQQSTFGGVGRSSVRLVSLDTVHTCLEGERGKRG